MKIPTAKRPRSESPLSERDGSGTCGKIATTTRATSQHSKKPKLNHPFVSHPPAPFPENHRPSPSEAREVYHLLCEAHGTPDVQMFVSAAQSSVAAAAPNVLEGLISTILSQSTSGSNSSRAKAALDNAFGRNNFLAIATAPQERVIEAIRCGGLAKKKAATIQSLLEQIRSKHGSYSLQFLAASGEDERKTDAEVTQELLSYAGVGPKTAACVLSLCFGRQSFAVDTHVWRLSKVLGWVPETADRVRTQAHLDQRLPGDLKHGLHVLMMRHGRTCAGCKKSGQGACILKTYRQDHLD
ncbi:DNA glycosylase [Mycena galericulata]|nr:DNA glycosylase [Mycena galericulata]